MSKFNGDDAYRYVDLAAHEDSSHFGFGIGGHGVLDGVTHDVEWCISHGVFECGWVLAKDVPNDGSTVGFGQDEVCGV